MAHKIFIMQEPGHILSFHSTKTETFSTSMRLRHFVFAPIRDIAIYAITPLF